MTKNIQSPGKRRFNEVVLNSFAVIMACMPVISIGYWVQHQLFGDQRTVVALSEIQSSDTPLLFEEPLVSITFDDGWESVYSNGAPILEKYNIRTTQYILPGQFKAPNYLSLEQSHSLQKAGHEMMSHTMTHSDLTDISAEQLVYELSASKEIMQKEGFTTKAAHFAAPESATNPEVMGHIKSLYSSHRNTYADLSDGIDRYDVNVGPTLDSYNILAFSVRSTTTESEIIAALEYAKKHNGWLVLVYHQIDDSATRYTVSPKTFDRHMQIIHDSRIKASPLGSVIDTWNERQQ